MNYVNPNGKYEKLKKAFYVDENGKYQKLKKAFIVNSQGKYEKLWSDFNELELYLMRILPNRTDHTVYHSIDGLKTLEEISSSSGTSKKGGRNLIYVKKDDIGYLVVSSYAPLNTSGWNMYKPAINYSLDFGETWTQLGFGPSQYYSNSVVQQLHYKNGVFYAIINYESSDSVYAIYISTDMTAWTRSPHNFNDQYSRSSPGVADFTKDAIIMPYRTYGVNSGTNSYYLYSFSDTTGEKLNSYYIGSDSTVNSYSEVISNKESRAFVICLEKNTSGNLISTLYYTDDNCKTCTKLNVSSFNPLSSNGASMTRYKGVYVDGRWIVAAQKYNNGSYITYIYYSTNLSSWTLAYTFDSTSAIISKLQYINNVLYLIFSGGPIYASTNKGLTWVEKQPVYKHTWSDGSTSSYDHYITGVFDNGYGGTYGNYE